MTPKERWSRMKELIEALDGATKFDGAVVDELVEHYKQLDTIRLRTIEDLQFSESPNLNRAADFECARCGAPLRVTEVTCGACADKTIEEIADEKRDKRQKGLPWGESCG